METRKLSAVGEGIKELNRAYEAGAREGAR